MKLIVAVIHDEDSNELTDKLNEKNYMATKLASTGGFLKSGNTTLFVGVDDKEVDNVVEIIKDTCKTKKGITLPTPNITPILEGAVAYPIEVVVGGATVFVLDVEQFFKF